MAENKQSGSMKTIIPWVLFGVTAIGFVIYAVVGSNGPDVSAGNVGEEAVAKVDNETITANDLYKNMSKQIGAQVIDQMIMQKLIENKAKAENVTVSDEDLNKQIDQIKKNFPSEDMFNQQLALSGLTIDDLKKELVTEVQLNKLLEPKINITDEQIAAYFEENKESFNTPEEIRASHILVENREKAEELMAKLKEGADFAELAKENSTDPGSAAQGGDLGFFGKGRMVPQFEEAAFALKVGEMSEIVESQYGYHIIKLVDRKEATTAKLEEKKEEIRETLFSQQRSQIATSYLEELKAEADVENYFETKNT